MGKYTILCILFFACHVIISDFNTDQNRECLRNYFIREVFHGINASHTLIELSETTETIASAAISICSTYFVWKLPVCNF
jgi:hypothetical protein